MPTLETNGTSFTLQIPSQEGEDGFWAKTTLKVSNEYLSYAETGRNISREELETLCSALSRLLAGGYDRTYTLNFEKAGLTVDLYAYTENGCAVSREERRKNDCVMSVRLLLRSSDGTRFLGGVYSLFFHRKEIEKFAEELSREYEAAFAHLLRGKGEFHFAGVSPKGYRGCNYLYYDPTGKVEQGDYVWVTMGRHHTEQIVYVDSVRDYTAENAPYNPKTVKQVLRMATGKEVRALLNEELE